MILVALLGLALFCPSGEDREVDRRALQRLSAPPLGLPPVPGTAEVSAARIALGRKLFFDRRLSVNGTMSCGMCHIPEQGFSSHELATPVGVFGRSLRRNAPTMFNVAYANPLFHDGRESTLEAQVVGPLLSPDEMANPSEEALLGRIRQLPDYQGRFEEAFGDDLSMTRIGEAIAAWERTLLSADTPFDRWFYGEDAQALEESARQGFELFRGKAGCAQCHTVSEDHALFTDLDFHDTGLGYRNSLPDDSPVHVEISPGVVIPVPRPVVESVGDPARPDHGRFEVTGESTDRWRYRTPTLRNVALTAPYMHDGSLRTLEEVLRFYNSGGFPHSGLDPRIRPLDLTPEELEQLQDFLEALTGSNVDELVADARSVPVGN